MGPQPRAHFYNGTACTKAPAPLASTADDPGTGDPDDSGACPEFEPDADAPEPPAPLRADQAGLGDR